MHSNELSTSEAEGADVLRSILTQRMEAGDLRLPVIPKNAQELLDLCNREDADVGELQALVGNDPTLCAHVLRIANSAAYMPAVPIISVSLAITRLGLNTFRGIAMSAAVQEALVVEGWEDVVSELWEQASTTAALARAVAQRCGSGVQRAGLFGLLQDVGKPIVLHVLTEICPDDVELTRPMIYALMEEFHAAAGAEALRQWSMPAWLGEVVAHHHEFDAAGEFREEAMIANLADCLGVHARDAARMPAEQLLAQPVCACLGFQNDDLTHLLGVVEELNEAA